MTRQRCRGLLPPPRLLLAPLLLCTGLLPAARARGGSGAVATPWLNPNASYSIANPAAAAAFAPGFVGRHFDLLSPPITSKYGAVVWDVLPAVDLPPALVAYYGARPDLAMAVTGFEVDVVRNATDPRTGALTPALESVPCFDSYNHHYVSALHGKGGKVTVARPLPLAHGAEFSVETTAFSRGDVAARGFDAQSFNEHNGNEARQTYHGMPAALPHGRQYAVGISQPEKWTFGPMQINTRNPDGSGRRCDGKCPLPRSSNAPPGAPWSGILECPCTTRVVKTFGGHFTQAKGQCANPVDHNATECFVAAAALLGPGQQIASNATTHTVDAPAGCLIRLRLSASGKPTYSIAFNEPLGGGDGNTAAVACGASSSSSSSSSSSPSSSSQRRYGANLAGTVVGLVVDADPATGNVTLTLTTNDTAHHWYGVGLNASAMDGAYAIVVSGGDDVPTVTEHRLGNHNPGKVLQTHIEIVSHTVTGHLRTTVLRRLIAAATPDHFSFAGATSQLPFIAALGDTPGFSQHRVKGAATLSLTSVGAATCVCRGGTGAINGFPFNPKCMGEPLSDLLKTGNPTCDINKYSGGMACCRGGQILLDADQTQPGPPMTVFYHWRFYYEDWDPQRHRQTYHLEWQFGHIEYDVPRAPVGTPRADAVHTLTTRFTGMHLMSMGNANAGGADGQGWDLSNASRPIELIMMGFHCHSPACLGGELYNADTNELLCAVKPVAGKGQEPQDESSYLWLPPCQWGDPALGLAPPPVITGETNLLGIKRARSDVGHYGVMAIFQGRGAWHEGTW